MPGITLPYSDLPQLYVVAAGTDLSEKLPENCIELAALVEKRQMTPFFKHDEARIANTVLQQRDLVYREGNVAVTIQPERAA